MAASGWLLAVSLAVSFLLIHSMAADDTEIVICAIPTATACAINNSNMHGQNLYRPRVRHTVHLTPARDTVNERECGPFRTVKREDRYLIRRTGSIADFQHLHTESLIASTPKGEPTEPRFSDYSRVVRESLGQRASPLGGGKTKERVHNLAPEKLREVPQDMTNVGMRGLPEDPADEGPSENVEAAMPSAGRSFDTQRGAGYEADNPEGLQPMRREDGLTVEEPPERPPPPMSRIIQGAGEDSRTDESTGSSNLGGSAVIVRNEPRLSEPLITTAVGEGAAGGDARMQTTRGDDPTQYRFNH
jgi:hypothetical protein